MSGTHPIRKLLANLDLHNAATTHTPNHYQKAVAKHVKPLLDALEESDAATEHQPYEEGNCRFCRLLAAWREKL